MFIESASIAQPSALVQLREGLETSSETGCPSLVA